MTEFNFDLDRMKIAIDCPTIDLEEFNLMLESELFEEALNISIVEELLKGINPSILKEEIQEIWLRCDGNPWDAGVLYTLLKLKEKQND